MPRTTRPQFDSLDDARTALSGYLDWEWGGTASFDGLCEFAYETARAVFDDDGDRLIDESRDEIVYRYLGHVGENSLDYGIFV